MTDDWRGYMTRLIAAVEASGAQDDTFAQLFQIDRKRRDGKSECDAIRNLRQAINEAKACLAMYPPPPPAEGEAP